ncbi:MAG: HEAT repeat domain-containing protein [Myxococcales bacterium]|nr:HEAT repeat domain-containing protein [Myxococcales bacterium]
MGLLSAIKDSGDQRWADILLECGKSAEGTVSEAAFGAMSSVRDARFIPLLIERLDKRDRRSVIREALIALGDPALDALERALQDQSLPFSVRIHNSSIDLLRFPTPRAVDCLLKILREEPSGAIRYKALRGLGRLQVDHRLRVDTKTVERRANMELREYLRLLALWFPIHEGLDERPAATRASGKLLVLLLEDKQRQALERAFRLLQLAHPRESIRSVSLALRSRDRQMRAKALEYIDALTLASSVPSNRELIRIVGDDLSPRERLHLAELHDIEPPEDYRATLLELIREPSVSIAGLAAYHALELGEPGLREEVTIISEERSLGGSLRSFIELMTARRKESTGAA